eukprot:gene15795-18727_t
MSVCQGQVVFNEENFKWGGSADISEKMYELGPFVFVTVGAGEVGQKWTYGRLTILEAGTHQLNSAEGETFHGFLSVQQQVMKVKDLHLTTLDQVDLKVDAVLTWSISDAQKAITDVRNLEEVLRQRTETSLSTIFSHVKYSQKAVPLPSFDTSSTGPGGVVQVPSAAEQLRFQAENALSTTVHNEFMGAIKATAASDWGVQISDLSVDNIEIVNRELAIDLERRAVIAVQTDTAQANAENAKAVNLIEAETLTQKRILEAEADTAKTVAKAKAGSEVKRMEAEAEAEAARVVAEGEAAALRIMSAAEAEARVTKAQAEKTATELEAQGSEALGSNALQVRQWDVQSRMVKDMYENQRTFVDSQQMPTMAEMLNFNTLNKMMMMRDTAPSSKGS